MRSKSKRKIIAEKKTKNSKHNMKQNPNPNYARRSVTHRASSLDEQCPMRIVLILSSNKQWFLLSTSSLEHLYHPPLGEQATLLSQKDLTSRDEQLINILCDANVPPSKITKIMSSIREDDKGTLLPKTIFNINEKCRRLIGMSIRIYQLSYVIHGVRFHLTHYV